MSRVPVIIVVTVAVDAMVMEAVSVNVVVLVVAISMVYSMAAERSCGRSGRGGRIEKKFSVET